MKILIFFAIALVVLFILFKIFKAFLKWSIIILVIILVIAFFTNPDHAAHHQSLKDYTNEKNLKRVREKLVDIDDYKIFSLTKVKVEGKEKIVGIGAFGKVWYFSELEEKLKKKNRKQNS
jgi:energy-coupling factor transporter transmembrane protein EcfT